MHSIHLEFNTLQELQDFMSARSNPIPSFGDVQKNPVVTPIGNAANPLGIVMELLEDVRFSLRSVSTVCEKSGLNRTQLFDLFDKEDIDVVTRTKRGSGDELVGLADRN